MVKREDYLTADLSEIDATIHGKWGPILRMYAGRAEPDINPFLERFGVYVSTHECPITPLTVGIFRKIAQRKSDQTSCGVDGWRMREIAALPDPSSRPLSRFSTRLKSTASGQKESWTPWSRSFRKGRERPAEATPHHRHERRLQALGLRPSDGRSTLAGEMDPRIAAWLPAETLLR